MAEPANDAVHEAIKAVEEEDKRRCPDDLFVNLTIRRVRRSIADKIVDAAAKLNGRVEISMDTAGPQVFRSNGG